MDWYRVETIMANEFSHHLIEESERLMAKAQARLWLTARAAPKNGRQATPLERDDVVRAVAYAAGAAAARSTQDP